MSHDARLRREVRDYYDTVSRYIEKELLARSDRAFWEEIVDEVVDEAVPDEGSRSGEIPSVLELGCGTGRITRVLASGPHRAPSRDPAPSPPRVVGVDLSREMLRRAGRRLEDHPNVQLVLADMRSLRLARVFDLVVAANDPFVHLVEETDRDRTVKTVAGHLKPGGRFLLDAFWLGEDRLERAAAPGGYRRERTVEPGGGGDGAELRIRERWTCESGSRRCTVHYEYLRDGHRIDQAVFRGRLWSPEELRDRLEGAGLRIESTWGGFDRRPFDPDDASHLIVDARRKKTC